MLKPYLRIRKAIKELVFDEKSGFLFIGCIEGKVVILDVRTGKLLGAVRNRIRN